MRFHVQPTSGTFASRTLEQDTAGASSPRSGWNSAIGRQMASPRQDAFTFNGMGVLSCCAEFVRRYVYIEEGCSERDARRTVQ